MAYARRILGGWALALLGCGTVTGDRDPDAVPADASLVDGAVVDGAPTTDASTARCDPRKPFGAPTITPMVNTSFDEYSLTLTRDERTAVISRDGASNTGAVTIATRERPGDPFGAPVIAPVLSALNDAPGSEYSGSLSSDGLLLYFYRQAPSPGGITVQVATRGDVAGSFDAGSTVFLGIDPLGAFAPILSADGQTLYWIDYGDFRLMSAARGSPTSFSGARAVGPANTSTAVLSADELTLYYADGSQTDVLVSTRSSTAGTFGDGGPLEGVNSDDKDSPLFLTADGCVLYLVSSRPAGSAGVGGMDIWEARRPI